MKVIKCNSILLMLDHFKKEHEQTNRALIENGEGKRCTKWEGAAVAVKDVIDFVECNTNKKL